MNKKDSKKINIMILRSLFLSFLCIVLLTATTLAEFKNRYSYNCGVFKTTEFPEDLILEEDESNDLLGMGLDSIYEGIDDEELQKLLDELKNEKDEKQEDVNPDDSQELIDDSDEIFNEDETDSETEDDIVDGDNQEQQQDPVVEDPIIEDPNENDGDINNQEEIVN